VGKGLVGWVRVVGGVAGVWVAVVARGESQWSTCSGEMWRGGAADVKMVPMTCALRLVCDVAYSGNATPKMSNNVAHSLDILCITLTVISRVNAAALQPPEEWVRSPSDPPPVRGCCDALALGALLQPICYQLHCSVATGGPTCDVADI
jgi:hypothetical protein